MFSKIIKNLILLLSLMLISRLACADNLGDLAKNVTATLEPITKLLTAGAYVGGVTFFIVAVFQFKQHKDNPTQVPLSKPMMILAMSSALIFLPSFIGAVSESIFGQNSTAEPGGFQPGTSS
jgi:intracellular multiplication protein IcmD